MKKLAVHKHLIGCKITESYDDKKEGYDASIVSYRRYTATIRGWTNWKIFEGCLYDGYWKDVCKVVERIRDLIDSGNEKIFEHKGYFIKEKQ